MVISDTDKRYMRVSLNLAEEALKAGDVPIGTCLTIEGLLIGSERNKQSANNNWFNHAENSLIKRFASEIKTARKQNKSVEVYTTVEPCLMCLGTMVHNRITRIVYSCPDPIAGSTHIMPPTKWYAKKWPKIESGPYAEESCRLMLEGCKKDAPNWKAGIQEYEKLYLSIRKTIHTMP